MSSVEELPDSPLLGWGTPSELLANQPLNNHSIAYEASRVIKSGPGILYSLTVYSSLAGNQWVQLFDANTVPADGAVPCCILNLSGTTAGLTTPQWFWTAGRTFQAGIVVCNSTTGPTKTIGAANCFFDAQFI